MKPHLYFCRNPMTSVFLVAAVTVLFVGQQSTEMSKFFSPTISRNSYGLIGLSLNLTSQEQPILGNQHPENDEELTSTVREHYFRWKNDTGIDIRFVMDSMKTLYEGKMLPLKAAREVYLKRFGPVPAFIVYDPTLPEGKKLRVWRSKSVFRMRDVKPIHPIYTSITNLINEALQFFLAYHRLDAQRKYPALWRVLNTTGILPIILQLDDYIGCNYENIGNKSLPLFTVSQQLECPSALVLPTYTMADKYATYNTKQQWDDTFHLNNQKYPWSSKESKLFWRGKCTHYRWQHPSASIRNRIMTWAMDKARNLTDIFPVIGNGDHQSACNQKLSFADWSPPETCMKYRAILDMDGYSWSERFPRLLCSNSVVVKLAPKFGDYLHNTLIPGYHYIPSGETNLSSVLDYLFNATNDAHLQQIVRNANEWCRYHMTHPKLLEDVLDLFNGYVELLDREDISWLSWWKDHYIEYIQPGKSDFYHEANLTTVEEEKYSRDLHPKSLML